MQAVAVRDLVYTISAPALAGLLKPYRGLSKSHEVIRRRVDERGKIHSRTIRYALVAITDGCHTVNVPVTLLYDLLGALPAPVEVFLTAEALTFVYASGALTLDHQVPTVTVDIPVIDVRTGEQNRPH